MAGSSMWAHAGALDVARLEQAMRDAVALDAEGAGDHHLDALIAKPWGCEIRTYCDPFYDAWLLDIDPGHATSMHCHPRKETALLCLAGRGTLRSLDGAFEFGAFEVVQIGRGAFHRTHNTGDGPLHLVEVEMPRNKLDLLRCEDRYGRSPCAYERESFGSPDPLETTGAARLRRRAGQYRFDVVRGDALGPDVLFAVSLAVEHTLANRIAVFPRPSVAGSDAAYLTISR